MLAASQSYDIILVFFAVTVLLEDYPITPVFFFYIGHYCQTVYHIWHSVLVVVLMISNTKLLAVLFCVSFPSANKNVKCMINPEMLNSTAKKAH